MRWIRNRASDEGGYAVVVVLSLLLLTLGFGFAAVSESITARSHSNLDARERRAQQASEAGVQRMLYEESETSISNWNLNGGPLQLSNTVDCMPVTLNASGQITNLVTAYVNNAGVCPSTQNPPSYVDTVGNHAKEQAEFIPGQTNPANGAERIYWPKIVSLGWDDNGSNQVYQREEVILKPVAPLQAIEGMGNVTVNGITLPGLSAAVINGDIVARGSVALPSIYLATQLTTNLNATVNATVTAPVISGRPVTNVTLNPTPKSSIPLRSPVTISSTKSNCPTGGCPTVTGVPAGKTGTDGYFAASDTLNMTDPGESVTLSSGDYVFCNFNVTSGTVTASPTSSGAPVRIFIDNPNSNRCRNNGYMQSGGVWNGGNFNAATGIVNTLSGATAPSGLQIYVAGDGGYDDANTVSIAVSCPNALSCTTAKLSQYMVLYAPTSKVTINLGACTLGNLVCAAGVFDGALIGNDVTVTASTITQDLDIGNYPLYNGVQVFKPSQYILCGDPAPPNPPVTSLQGINDPTPTPSDVAHDTAGC